MHRKPKKSLGQNFLTDKNIRQKLIAACQLEKSDAVLEIGGGRGEITGMIAERVERIYSVEIDPALCATLKKSAQEHPNLEIINRDILKLDLGTYLSGLGRKIKVIGNIPYYIASPIIAHLLEHRNFINKIFLTVQEEFASRVCAKPGSKDYGAFSCFVQYYCLPKILFPIKKTSFTPVPKVDSSFLCLEIREAPAVKVNDEERFFRVVRAAFNKRRKMLKNSLEGVIPAQDLAKFLRDYHIDAGVRPENLALTDFANLANL
jgi:16S rRNA (adenine1518-N6/adenine1519-N6)-dimethyltransferase